MSSRHDFSPSHHFSWLENWSLIIFLFCTRRLGFLWKKIIIHTGKGGTKVEPHDRQFCSRLQHGKYHHTVKNKAIKPWDEQQEPKSKDSAQRKVKRWKQKITDSIRWDISSSRHIFLQATSPALLASAANMLSLFCNNAAGASNSQTLPASSTITLKEKHVK